MSDDLLFIRQMETVFGNLFSSSNADRQSLMFLNLVRRIPQKC